MGSHLSASTGLAAMSKTAAALPSALWVSQVLDWELDKVPKAERQSMLRLMQVFSEHSDRPELPDEAVLRRAFKSLAASHIQTMQENAQLRQYVEDLEATLATERNKAEGDVLQSKGKLTTAKVSAANSAKLADEWKKRCMGWKRNCMEMEKKYKRIAALAQRKLKIMDDGRPRPDLDLPETEDADATMDRLSDVAKTRPKPKPTKTSELRKFRLGDDIDPPKGFGVKPDGSRYGTKFPQNHRFGAGAKHSGMPSDQAMGWHQSARSDSERRPPRGIGRRPWRDPNASAGEEHSARVTDNLETIAALHKQGRLSNDEYSRAKETVLNLSMQDDSTLEGFMSAARSGSPNRPQTAPEPSRPLLPMKERVATVKPDPIDADKAKETLRAFREELSQFPFENVAELWVFFDAGDDHVNKFQLAKGLKLLGLGHHNLDEIVFAATGLDAANARIECRPFLKHFAWNGGKLPDVTSEQEKILYEAKLNRKRIKAKAMGKKELPAEVKAATGETAHDHVDKSHVSHVEEASLVHYEGEHVDADHARDTLKEVVDHLPSCGFANVAEAFVLINANGDDWITRAEMENALKHLRIDHINLNALMFATALAGSDAGHYGAKIGFNQFLKHFTWKGGELGKDSEKALYEAKLKRKQILRHTEATLEAKESATVWPEEEIDRLLELVKKEGVGSWDEKAKELGTGRSGEEVRRHYHDVLDPNKK